MNHQFFKPLVGLISKHITHQIYDKNVFRIIHQFNNFNPHKDWEQIIDLEVEHLYHQLPRHSQVLRHACKSGNQSIIDNLISHGANDWNCGLEGACQGGHQHIVELLIRRGANDWNRGLRMACYCGHQSVAQYIINQAKQAGYSIDESIYKRTFNV